MTQPAPVFDPRAAQLEAAYRAQRIRLAANVSAAVAFTWAHLKGSRDQAIGEVVRLVEAGQAHTVRLVDAYMSARTRLEIGAGGMLGLDPALYTTSTLRGVPAAVVYGRPFGAYYATLNQGLGAADALRAAQTSAAKLAATDMQLAQTHAARDWMQENAQTERNGVRIVGYRRVLNPPSCKLCELAAKRTYRVADLLPIHEHCDCTVSPLYGREPVASVGTTVRVDDDPELGPRLMADSWSPVGPRLIA